MSRRAQKGVITLQHVLRRRSYMGVKRSRQIFSLDEVCISFTQSV